jgi:hypothetical protein
MIPLVIIISVLIAVLFFVSLGFLISFIISIVKKDEAKRKRTSIMFFSSLILFIVLIGLDIYLIVSYVYTNRNAIIDKTIEKSSDILSKGLALTASNFEKNWDKNLIKKYENLEVSIYSSKFKVVKGNKKYQIELLFNNSNLDENKIYLHDLVGNNYIVVCDKDDLVYILNPVNVDNDKIPVGKTKYSFKVTVSNEVNLDYIRFLHAKINLE